MAKRAEKERVIRACPLIAISKGAEMQLSAMKILQASLVASFLLLSGCGGGSSSSTSGPPVIRAELGSFPTTSAPLGFNSGASAKVLDKSSGASISTATVTMNGVTLNYDQAQQNYVGNVVVAPGAVVNLKVTTGGTTYTASATQFTSYPAISAPASGTNWDSNNNLDITWSDSNTPANAVFYGLGMLDADDPNKPPVWPMNKFFTVIPIGTTSYSIPAHSVTAGNRLAVVGIVTTVSIPDAASGSSLTVGGYNYVRVTVPGTPVTQRTSPTTASFNGITWSGTQFVAVGSGGSIFTSPDGITWTSRSSGNSNTFQNVIWAGAQFVAVDVSGNIVTSPNGVTWSTQVSNTINPLYSVAWSGSTYVAVGFYGTLLTSTDGKTWTLRTTGTLDILQGVAWSGTKFVVVGRSGTILTSSDGVLWTQQTSVGAGLNSVIWTGTQFLAVGTHGAIVSSPDGITWTSHSIATTDSLLSVAWSGSQFVAVGGSGNTSTLFSSSDGVTWSWHPSGASNTLASVTWSGTKFVMAGWGGIIFTSP